MVKKFNLSKPQIDKLNTMLTVAQYQQELFDAITDRYRNFILNIFDVLKIDVNLFQYTKVDLQNGVLLIDEPEKKDEKQIQLEKDKLQPVAQSPKSERSRKV